MSLNFLLMIGRDIENKNNKSYSINNYLEETCIDFSLVKKYYRDLAEDTEFI